MRLLDAKNSHWPIRHFYVMMAAAGIAVLIGGFFLAMYLQTVNQAILNHCAVYYDQTNALCPNFVYYHEGGDSTLVFFLTLAIGGGLLILSPVIAFGYWSIRN